MRLIDLDKVSISVHASKEVAEEVGRQLINAPIVKAIPLDKPFCKTVYGDYVCYNREWLMRHLPMELDILQGKEYQPSIPIEWIVDWLTRQHIPATHTCDDYYAVEMMLEDWEKENER